MPKLIVTLEVTPHVSGFSREYIRSQIAAKALSLPGVQEAQSRWSDEPGGTRALTEADVRRIVREELGEDDT